MEENNVNCWEFKECGREPGGKNVSIYGVCPAAVEDRADGIHQGKNGGRCCWVISGAHCKKKKLGEDTAALTACRECDFYNIVKDSTNVLVTV
ncbi:MAG: hypothetical protein D3924_08470 [Candidatus Electrothrix sp. AR4]|nr:hypothetical protein [Candidatus Electrothrix sp. AR4]